MIAIKIGTTSWRATESLGSGEVEFTGAFVYESDGQTLDMAWDEALQNIRPRNAAEKAAIQAARHAAQADRTAYEADRADLQAQYAAAATRLAQIRDAASPTNAQVVQAVRDLAAYQLKILKYLRKL